MKSRPSETSNPGTSVAGNSKLKHLTRTARFTTKATVELVASAIPGIGGTIATAIATLETERISRRLEAFVDEVRERYSSIQEEKLDSDFIQSELFADIVMAAIDAGRRSSDRDKRRLLAATLVGAATVDRPPRLDAEALLDTLSGLSPEDLHVARLLFEGVDRTLHGIVGGASVPANVPDVDFHIARLVAAGLFVGRGPLSDFAVQQTSYFPTETFERLLELLKAGGLDFAPDQRG